MNGLTLPSSRV